MCDGTLPSGQAPRPEFGDVSQTIASKGFSLPDPKLLARVLNNVQDTNIVHLMIDV
jgi:hypothetical protein